MKAGDIVGAIFDPGQFFYKPKGASGTKDVDGASGTKDKDVSAQLGPVTQLLASAPGPVKAILGGVLK
jgi:hypothetical protein